jgi:hypothetical protein
MLEHFREVIVDFASVAEKKNDYLPSILVNLADELGSRLLLDKSLNSKKRKVGLPTLYGLTNL